MWLSVSLASGDSMGVGRWIVVIGALASLALAGAARADCKMVSVEAPVTMAGLRPMIPAKINGHPVEFTIDSGAFFSAISPSMAAELKLPVQAGPWGVYVLGVGGEATVNVTRVDTFTLANTPFRRIEFMVTPGIAGDDSAGLLGRNFLAHWDVEYDFAHGVIRVIEPHGCEGKSLAYWSAGLALNILPFAFQTVQKPAAEAEAYVNGRRIQVMFDTGAGQSMLTRRAAERVGIRLDAPEVLATESSRGIGPKAVRTWIVPVASFKIGDEEIKSTRLFVSDTNLDDIDMLIGADFFLSHRIYIANSQKRIFFTYNGGPVFRLVAPASVAVAEGGPQTQLSPAQGAPTQAAPAQDKGPAEAPVDADGFSRRGAAYAARHDYSRAIADLDKACELAPREPRYVLQRARVRLEQGKAALARDDLERVLDLDPQNLQALALRAELRWRDGDAKGAAADLDTTSKLAPREADIRSSLGRLYLFLDDFAGALREYDLWIAAHGGDGEMHEVLAQRCWARALANRELDGALGDCSRSLRLAPRSANVLDSRGLVHLRLNQLDAAISDYDAALAMNPKIAWSLYGRGLAKLRKGLKADGEADIAAAVAIQPQLPERAKRYGVVAGP